MVKKIDRALLIVLLLSALLILVIPRPSMPVHSAAGETTVPTKPTPTTEEAQPPEDETVSVRKLLEDAALGETALCYSVYDPELHASTNAPGLGSEAYGFGLAEYCADTPINPVVGFMELVRPELFQREEAEAGMLEIPLYDAFENPAELKHQELSVEPETYKFSQKGASALVADLVRISEKTGAQMDYEGQLLGLTRNLKAEVHYSEWDECYYTYFLYYGDATASFVCLYLRSDNGTEITDVELQVLDCDYFSYDIGAGFSMSQENIRCERLWQLASWITALEKLMTGQTRVGLEGEESLSLPLAYQLEGSNVTLKQSTFFCDRETGWESAELVTYRIKK